MLGKRTLDIRPSSGKTFRNLDSERCVWSNLSNLKSKILLLFLLSAFKMKWNSFTDVQYGACYGTSTAVRTYVRPSVPQPLTNSPNNQVCRIIIGWQGSSQKIECTSTVDYSIIVQVQYTCTVPVVTLVVPYGRTVGLKRKFNNKTVLMGVLL